MPLPRSLILLMTALAVSSPFAQAESDALNVPADIRSVLKGRCIECHSGDSAEGDVRLDTIGQLELADRLEVMNRAQEQLFLGRMPPEDADQPTAAERKLLADWLSRELRRFKASKLEQKLQRPEFGNYVDHEKPFAGEFKDVPGFTYDRRWLISEYIFNAKFQRILQVNSRARRNGQNVPVFGSHRINQLSLTNPLLLPDRSGVRYYANTDLTGGHFFADPFAVVLNIRGKSFGAAPRVLKKALASLLKNRWQIGKAWGGSPPDSC